MHILKERAVQKIYQSFLRHFYPEQDSELDDLLLSRKPIGESQNTKPTDVNDRRNCIDEFQRAFNRAHFFAKREGVEFELGEGDRVHVIEGIETALYKMKLVNLI